MIGNEKTLKRILMVLIGICISVIGAFVWSNGGYEKGGLLQLGNIYDIPKESIKTAEGTCVYNQELDRYLVQGTTEELYISTAAPGLKWRYCTIEVSGLNVVPMVWNIELIDWGNKAIYSGAHKIRMGTNNLKISAKKGQVQFIKITIHNQPGYTFKIEEIKLRQRYFDMEDFLSKAVVIMLLCIIAYILVHAFRGMDWYFLVDMLQGFYRWTGNRLGKKISDALGTKQRERLQTFVFSLMFLLMIVMNVVSGESFDTTGQYWIYGMGILFALEGLLFWSKPLQKLDWKNSICSIWLLLWSMITISDILVVKSFAYVGYIMILFAGFAFFVWCNERCFQRVLYSMMNGLEWTLLPILVYCVLCRQKKLGVFYNGCFPRHESVAMYALALLMVFLADWNLLFCQKRLYRKKIVICGIGAALSCVLLYFSRTTVCVVAAGVVVVLWVVKQVINLIKYRRPLTELVILALVTGIIAMGSTIGLKQMIEILPEKLGTKVVYENEVQESMIPLGDMYALEAENPGWMEGVTQDDVTARMSVWKTYIQKLNLIGNEDNLRVSVLPGARYLNPANGILQVAYRYGIVILAPYVLLLLLCIYSALTERRFLWNITVFAFVIVLMFENIEMPFTQPLWLMFYLQMGRLLGDKPKNDVRLENAND